MAVNENIMVRLTANISDYSAKMQQASAQTNQLATTMTKPANRLKQFETAATKTGIAIGAMSLAFGVQAVKQFADFDEAMSEVKANTGAAGDELGKLRNAALDAGKSTVFNATESANAINELAKAGMSTTDVLSGGLSGALNLAASDGMRVADAAELMSSALAQFNLSGKDAGAVADALAAGAAAAQGSASDLGYALSQSGVVAHSFGISMEETVGALAMFANTGMIGSDAGTSLKSMLQRLANPSKEAALLMEELGLQTYDASGNFVGLSQLAENLKTSMSGLTQEQRNAAMATIFGSDAVRAANALYANGAKGVDQWTKTVSESGVAAEMAAAKTDNLKGDLEQLGGAFETALIKTGSGANDALRGVVQTVTDVVDAFASLDDGTQQTIVTIGLAIGAVATLHKAFGGLKDSSSGFGKALGLAFDPVQRLQVALPAFSTGVKDIGSALLFTGGKGELMANGLSRSSTAMSGLKSIGSGLFGLLGGPWGLALTAGGLALGAWAKQAAEAAQKAKDFTSALNNGQDATAMIIDDLAEMKLGTNSFSQAIGRWQLGVSDIPDMLDKAGLSMATFAKAVTGDKEALSEYNAKMKELEASTNAVDHDRMIRLKGIFKDEKKAYEEATRLSEQRAEALEGEVPAAENAADASGELSQAMQDEAASVEDLNDQLDALIKSLFSIESPTLSAAQAQVALDSSVRETVAELTQQGAVLGQNGEYLAGFEKQGEGAKDSLYNLAAQAQNTATKILEEGQATGQMDEATKRAGAALDQAREGFIKAATAAGISDENARKLADTYGLTSGKTDELASNLKQLDQTHANPKVDAQTEEASDKIENLKIKTQNMPNGKVMITGNNDQAMTSIAEVVGAEIDPKTGQIMANKDQFDIILALVNGAKIDPKTGMLKGDNNEYWQKLAKTNGWKIGPKTGFIYGNNGHAITAINAVTNKNIQNKYFSVFAHGADSVEAQMGRIQNIRIGDKSFNVTTYYNEVGEKVYGGTIPRATGGYISGPGSGISDSIPARLSNGEYVINARATAKYRSLLDAINYGNAQIAGYANGGYVQATPAANYMPNSMQQIQDRIVYQQTNNFRMYTQSNPRTQADLIAAKVRFRGQNMMGA